ncbi:MAG TPA: aquaporin [Candidatus Dormibacteraeota bacterium]|nr:aquaporin [Candidatus Dormibacteraeota bacterium]
MRARLLTEFVGTFVFLTVIALSGAAGQLAPLAIGLALAAMVYMGGHVSGAHYNPAVTFALWLRGVIPPATVGLYWVTQLVAGALAFWFAYLISGHTPGIHPGYGVSVRSALAAEVVFTAALALVVLNVAATKETAGNSYYGLAIGLTVAAGGFTVGPISGAAFNPAVALGATLAAALFANGGWSDLSIYIAGPLVGAAIGAGIHVLQQRAKPVPPETSERA